MTEIPSLHAFKYYCFNRNRKIYKKIAAIRLTDSSGNPIVSQTKYGSDQISCQLLALRCGERARWQGGRALH